MSSEKNSRPKFVSKNNKTKSALWRYGSASIIATVITFIGAITLAILLSPKDYGYLTSAMIVTGFANIINVHGFQTYVLQRQSQSGELKKCVDTVLCLDLLFSFVCSVIVLAIGSYYSAYLDKIIGQMLLIYSIDFVLLGLIRIPLAGERSDLDYRNTSKVLLLNVSLSTISKILFAFSGYESFSFPLGIIAGDIGSFLYIYGFLGYRPRLANFRKDIFKAALSFGKQTIYTSIVSFIANQYDKFLLTNIFPNAVVGTYSFAQSNPKRVYSLIASIVSPISISSYAKYREDLSKLRSLVFRIIERLSFILMPIFIFAFIERYAIISNIFGQKWLGAVELFGIFCLLFVFNSVFSTVTGIQLSFGLAGKAKELKIKMVALIAICVTIGALFDNVVILALSFLVGSILATLLNAIVNLALINAGIIDLLKANWKVYLVNFLSICLYLSFLQLELVNNSMVFLLIKVLIFFTIYLCLSYLFVGEIMQALYYFITKSVHNSWT